MFKPNSNRAQPVTNNKEQATTGVTRLVKVWSEPSLENIQSMLSEAKKKRRQCC